MPLRQFYLVYTLQLVLCQGITAMCLNTYMKQRLFFSKIIDCNVAHCYFLLEKSRIIHLFS
jgi:hypothetical protein